MGIIAGAVVAIALIFFAFTMFSGGDDTGDTGGDEAAAPSAIPAAGPPPTVMDAGTGAPVDATATGGAATAKPKPPTEISRADPFAPLFPRPKPNPEQLMAMAARQELAALPPLTIYQPNPTALAEGGQVTGPALAPQEAPDTTQRRVAGIVMGKNASAIMEIDGGTVVVQPGDVLPDLSRVERIERDRVLLRKGSRAIFVPLSSNPNGAVGGGPVGGPGTAGPYGPGRAQGPYGTAGPYARPGGK
jgi:hypothetical protein